MGGMPCIYLDVWEFNGYFWQSFWQLLVLEVYHIWITAEYALGENSPDWRWALGGVLLLPLGLKWFSLCTVSSMWYGPPHAFLQLSYNLEPLVISNPQAPQSDQCCSWYCRLKMTGLFLVGCASRDDRRYKDVKWCKKCKKSFLPALISRFGWLCVII